MSEKLAIIHQHRFISDYPVDGNAIAAGAPERTQAIRKEIEQLTRLNARVILLNLGGRHTPEAEEKIASTIRDAVQNALKTTYSNVQLAVVVPLENNRINQTDGPFGVHQHPNALGGLVYLERPDETVDPNALDLQQWKPANGVLRLTKTYELIKPGPSASTEPAHAHWYKVQTK
ncbi:hypothetical protein IPJ72_04485 [Candidatus Peregrinibacteria bacterium]|nr:MAG: hypothetical protein IPJ72_04485 [Candidatus Peregrinibacteria bacterium]